MMTTANTMKAAIIPMGLFSQAIRLKGVTFCDPHVRAPRVVRPTSSARKGRLTRNAFPSIPQATRHIGGSTGVHEPGERGAMKLRLDRCQNAGIWCEACGQLGRHCALQAVALAWLDTCRGTGLCEGG